MSSASFAIALRYQASTRPESRIDKSAGLDRLCTSATLTPRKKEVLGLDKQTEAQAHVAGKMICSGLRYAHPLAADDGVPASLPPL